MTELEKAKEFNRRIKEALTVVVTALNKGQRQKLMRNENVQAVFRRYNINIEES